MTATDIYSKYNPKGGYKLTVGEGLYLRADTAMMFINSESPEPKVVEDVKILTHLEDIDRSIVVRAASVEIEAGCFISIDHIRNFIKIGKEKYFKVKVVKFKN